MKKAKGYEWRGFNYPGKKHYCTHLRSVSIDFFKGIRRYDIYKSLCGHVGDSIDQIFIDMDRCEKCEKIKAKREAGDA